MPFRSLALSFSPALWAVIGFVLLLFSLSNDSIDMLESQTWSYARQDTFGGFLRELRNDATSDSEMPLGKFSYWAWSRASGTRELAMRSLNLLWAAVALAALARAGRRLSVPWLPLLFAVQPFVWYYMNYAKTPMMQMAGGAILVAGMIGYVRQDGQSRLDGILLCLGAVLLSVTNMFGLIPLVAAAIGLSAHGFWRRLRLSLAGKIVFFSTLAIFAALASYSAATLMHGAGGAPLWTVTPLNVLFAAYEFFGFQGLGPGRHELRSMIKGFVSARELLPYIPGLLMLTACYLLLLATAYKSWLTRNYPLVAGKSPPDEAGAEKPFPPRWQGYSLLHLWLLGLGVPALSGCLLFLIASLATIPFWGHHLAGAFPFWVLALAITIHWARQGIWRKTGRFAARGILVLLLVSSVLIRFAPFHRHDDYRGAVAEALRISASGRTVWWVADYNGGAYYGLPFAEPITGAPGEIQFAMNRQETSEDLPGAIILSRPDNFDAFRTASRLISSGGYKKVRELQAFEVWER